MLGFEVDFTPTQVSVIATCFLSYGKAGMNEIIARFVVENVPQVSPEVIAADGIPTSYESNWKLILY